jgi:hypothetical protein
MDFHKSNIQNVIAYQESIKLNNMNLGVIYGTMYNLNIA